MNVLFVDSGKGGHHAIYLNNLVNSDVYQSVCCLPIENTGNKVKQYIIKYDPRKNIVSYIKWIIKVASIADKEHADIVQFMQMDSLMKYFGLGFRKLKKERKIVIVYHHFWKGFFRKLSYVLIAKRVDYVVVHTQLIMDKLTSYGVNNIRKFEYPGFGRICNKVRKHLPARILAFGSIRYDKGLDILLEALKLVKDDFFLYIVGEEIDFDKEYIDKHISQYREKVFLDLRFVDDEEKERYFEETDIVVLPYRRIFDGASGPLTDGVIKEKVIIGPNHGSIKHLIEENHIGYVFCSESPYSLAEMISRAIRTDFIYDEKALCYREYISPERMRREYEELLMSLMDDGG